MKICTFFTDEYRPLMNRFVDSFPWEEDIELIINYVPSPSSLYYLIANDNWAEAMYQKIKFVIDILQRCKENEIVVYADIDVYFFNKIKADIKAIFNRSNKDIYFMNDHSQLCMGFFACKKNNNVLNFLKTILEHTIEHRCDQRACNAIFAKKNAINFGFLPFDKYFNIGHYYHSTTLKEDKLVQHVIDQNIEVPKSIHVFHANFITGCDCVRQKLKMIDFIKSKIV